MICRNCGKEIPDSVRFCTGCGRATDARPADAEGSAVVVIQPTEKSASSLPSLSFALGLVALLLTAVPLSFALVGFLPLAHIWSGVFGLLFGPLFLAVSCVAALAGLVLGIVSLVNGRKKAGKTGLAVWGVCLSLAGLLAGLGSALLAILSVLMLPLTCVLSYCAALAGAVYVLLLFLFVALGGLSL